MIEQILEEVRLINKRLSVLETGNTESSRPFSPREVAQLATAEGFPKTAETVRTWCRLRQVDFEQLGDREPIKIYPETVERLRENLWRPLRKPDYSKLPLSRKARCSPSQSVASNNSVKSPSS